ncbi:MAG: hypothetical protein ACP5HQ_02500 [Thermoprotei archaeon]
MNDNVRPIYARGFFSVSIDGQVNQLIVFYYFDPDAYYAGLSYEELKRENQRLRDNLQYFLDEEKISINGIRVRAKVRYSRIGLISTNYPFAEFVVDFRGPLLKGENVYENEYEREVAEYPYEAIWVFPGEVVDFKMAGRVRKHNNILEVLVDPGTETGGVEWIKFRL